MLKGYAVKEYLEKNKITVKENQNELDKKSIRSDRS